MALIGAAALVALLATATSGAQIAETDIVDVGFYSGADATCSGTAALRVRFDQCCPCFRWSFRGDVSSTKAGTYARGDDDFGWLSHITNDDCSAGGRTANKRADATCVKQTEGKTYHTKIESVTSRGGATCAELREAGLVTCEQGPHPTDAYVALAGREGASSSGGSADGARGKGGATGGSRGGSGGTGGTTRTSGGGGVHTADDCKQAMAAGTAIDPMHAECEGLGPRAGGSGSTVGGAGSSQGRRGQGGQGSGGSTTTVMALAATVVVLLVVVIALSCYTAQLRKRSRADVTKGGAEVLAA